MGWVSPKVYAILNNSEKGKTILEGIGDKDQATVDKEVDEFFHNSPVHKITSEDEKKFIKSKLKPVWQGSRAGPKIEFLGDDINEAINSLPRNESELILNALRDNVSGGIWQGKGQGYFSVYEKKIVLDRYMLLSSPYYEKNGVFFHEVGHAIDYSLGGGNRTISSTFISQKHNVSLAQMIYDEASQITDEQFEQIVKESEEQRQDNLQEKISVLSNELTSIIDEQEKAYAKIREKENGLIESKFGKEAVGIRVYQYNDMCFLKALNDNGIKSLSDFYELDLTKQQEIRKKIEPSVKKSVEEFKNFKQHLFEINPELKEASEEYSKIYQKKLDKNLEIERVKNVNTRIWGNVADLIGGAHKKKGADGINFGHSASYWETYQKYNLGTEAFAELFDGLTNSKVSYYNMKQVFPKSVEIFEEIINGQGRK